MRIEKWMKCLFIFLKLQAVEFVIFINVVQTTVPISFLPVIDMRMKSFQMKFICILKWTLAETVINQVKLTLFLVPYFFFCQAHLPIFYFGYFHICRSIVPTGSGSCYMCLAEIGGGGGCASSPSYSPRTANYCQSALS